MTWTIHWSGLAGEYDTEKISISSNMGDQETQVAEAAARAIAETLSSLPDTSYVNVQAQGHIGINGAGPGTAITTNVWVVDKPSPIQDAVAAQQPVDLL